MQFNLSLNKFDIKDENLRIYCIFNNFRYIHLFYYILSLLRKNNRIFSKIIKKRK